MNGGIKRIESNSIESVRNNNGLSSNEKLTLAAPVSVNPFHHFRVCGHRQRHLSRASCPTRSFLSVLIFSILPPPIPPHSSRFPPPLPVVSTLPRCQFHSRAPKNNNYRRKKKEETAFISDAMSDRLPEPIPARRWQGSWDDDQDVKEAIPKRRTDGGLGGGKEKGREAKAKREASQGRGKLGEVGGSGDYLQR